MKRVFIVHGWEGNPNNCWLPWMKENLEREGIKVIIPEMPNTDEPETNAWISFLRENVGEVNENTYFIGYSIGCQTILWYLESLEDNKKSGGVILIVPWMHLDEKTIEEEGEEIKEIAKPWVETPIRWDKVLSHTKDFVAIFSDNDPYVPLGDAEIFKKNLGAKIIIEKNKGHFDEEAKVYELPSALKEILNLIRNL